MDHGNRKRSSYLVENEAIRNKVVFHDDRDYFLFLKVVQEAKGAYKVSVLAFCLLPQGFGLVIQCEEGNQGLFVEEIDIAYTRYARERHRSNCRCFTKETRIGELREREEIIDAIRYVWRRPLEKGLVRSIQEHKWSSYRLLRKKSEFLDQEELERLLPQSNWQLIAHSQCTRFYEHASTARMSQTQAMRILCYVSATRTPGQILGLPDHAIGKALLKAHEKRVSKRQISEILGISRHKVDKYIALASNGCPFDT